MKCSETNMVKLLLPLPSTCTVEMGLIQIEVTRTHQAQTN